ncbi:protein ORF125 [Cyprinid herpesvirus 2]|uniref:Protein ORF125 n=1 Tax=Cyprinid herpesvirus 2 TaxID=317878 RepID=K7PCE0_CYHV2|nr:protein ORF125 [Cyprinid herpesvirus 2]AFJ20547.1 protein ORF125 [Cyprinid herpesvirus 2]
MFMFRLMSSWLETAEWLKTEWLVGSWVFSATVWFSVAAFLFTMLGISMCISLLRSIERLTIELTAVKNVPTTKRKPPSKILTTKRTPKKQSMDTTPEVNTTDAAVDPVNTLEARYSEDEDDREIVPYSAELQKSIKEQLAVIEAAEAEAAAKKKKKTTQPKKRVSKKKSS